MSLSAAELARVREQVAIKQQQLTASPLPAGVIPIVIKCRWSSCRHGRHTLDHHHTGGRGVNYPVGFCQECGESITDLPQPGAPMPFDDDQFFNVFARFPNELIRAHYWSVPIDLYAHNQALRLGKRKLLAKVRKQVRDSMLLDDAFKNRRAAWNGDIVAYAQHATATCCRLCASYWHGLPRDMKVTPTGDQLAYVVSLAEAYIQLRLPELPDEPSRGISGIPANAGPNQSEAAALEDRLLAAFNDDIDPAGLVLPRRSAIQLGAGFDATGGYVTPMLIPMSHPRT